MRDVSHTLIGTVHKAVKEWRNRHSWSRETVTQVIVAKFYELGGDKLTGIVFDPETTDIIDRQKVMADKLFRWLDDEFKDTNFLPANFLPYIMAALPVDLRIACANEILIHTGLTVRLTSHDACDDLTLPLQHLAKEMGEGIAAYTGLLNMADHSHLKTAHTELTEAADAVNVCLDVIESRMAQRNE